LEALLLDGIDSGGAVEADEAYWTRLRAETDVMAKEHLLLPGSRKLSG
jgi:hypothetical protein